MNNQLPPPGRQVDWEETAKYGPSQIDCHCGASYLSQSKTMQHGVGLVTLTRVSCPNCHQYVDNARAVRDLGCEVQIIRPQDVLRDTREPAPFLKELAAPKPPGVT